MNHDQDRPWLIFGGKGWIGGQFLEILKTKGQDFVHASSRADDTTRVRQELDQVKPSRVVSFIGRTHGAGYNTIDYLEQGRPQLVENIRDNLYGPLSLAMICHELGIHFTYLGTGCIFTYDQLVHTPDSGVGFTEDDDPNFFGSSYSICKGFTDRLMRHFQDNVLNLRIRMPVNDDLGSSRNFLHKILKYTKICSIPNSISILPDILPIMYDMIRKKTTGTVNLVNPGLISHNQILDMYREIIDPSFTYENMSVEEQNSILLSERSNNLLETTKLESEYFILPIYQSFQRLMKRIRKQKLLDTPYDMGRVLVTGGWGFIGSNFIHQLFLSHYRRQNTQQKKKYVIVNIDKRSYCSRAEYVEDIHGLVNYELDLNNTDEVQHILERHQIDTVVHFAAQSHVDLSFNNSLAFTQDNVRATHSLLEAVRRYGKIQRFLHVSTDEIYGETIQKDAFDETTPPNPTNPYAATKISAEFLVQSYYHCFEIPIMIIRGNNVYGPHQYPEKLIPRFIYHLLDHQPCPIHGNGQTRRNFLYVTDMCQGILTILEKGKVSDIYNIGDMNEYSVIDIAQYLVRLMISPTAPLDKYMTFVQDRYYNDFTYRINSSKLRELGWIPQISMEEGLKKTIEWYTQHRSLYSDRSDTKDVDAHHE